MATESLTSRSPWLQWILAEVFPRLRAWPLADWSRVLARARATPLDLLEKIGTLGSVLICALLYKPVLSANIEEILAYLVQFAVMLPVFALAFGPFYLRRIRRGIEMAHRDELAERRDAGAGSSGP